jgi:hypothetical protein
MVIHTRADKTDYMVTTKVTIPQGETNPANFVVDYSFTPAIETANGWDKDPSKPTFRSESALKAYQMAYRNSHGVTQDKRGANAQLIMGISYELVQRLIRKVFNIAVAPVEEIRTKISQHRASRETVQVIYNNPAEKSETSQPDEKPSSKKRKLSMHETSAKTDSAGHQGSFIPHERAASSSAAPQHSADFSNSSRTPPPLLLLYSCLQPRHVDCFTPISMLKKD